MKVKNEKLEKQFSNELLKSKNNIKFTSVLKKLQKLEKSGMVNAKPYSLPLVNTIYYRASN